MPLDDPEVEVAVLVAAWDWVAATEATDAIEAEAEARRLSNNDIMLVSISANSKLRIESGGRFESSNLACHAMPSYFIFHHPPTHPSIQSISILDSFLLILTWGVVYEIAKLTAQQQRKTA